MSEARFTPGLWVAIPMHDEVKPLIRAALENASGK